MLRFSATAARLLGGFQTKVKRMGHFVLLILAVAGVFSFSIAETQSEPPGVAVSLCCEDLQIPREGPSGNAGDKVGPVLVSLIPDGAGHPTAVNIGGPPSAAGILLKSWISGSTFSKKCAGKRLLLQFSFVIEGPPIDYPFSWVTFQSPNHFIVHSRSRLPRVLNPPGKL